jgi:hypothetical protein
MSGKHTYRRGPDHRREAIVGREASDVADASQDDVLIQRTDWAEVPDEFPDPTQDPTVVILSDEGVDDGDDA